MHLPPKGSHIHLMGICGVAMASLAGLLKEMGYHITGSDQNVYPPMSTQLANLGIAIKEGYKKENLNQRPDLVIVGNVITKQHEEAQALVASDIPYMSLPQALGAFVIADRKSIVVAGTHGKTTTTAMLAWIGNVCGKKLGFLVGGIPKNFGQSFQKPGSEYFLIEGDEYDTAFFDKGPKFLHYKPRYVVLTSIEFDHADIYKDLEAVKTSFRKLLQLMPQDGILVTHADDENIRSLLPDCNAKTIYTYGISNGDYQVRQINENIDYCSFDLLYHGKKEATLKLSVIGKFNIANAIATYALSARLGWPKENIIQALESFSGVKRRQEVIGKPNDIVVIEDFAHHPTAVACTVEAVQSRYKGRKVFAVFEPRSASSRRRIFQKAYSDALKAAPVVVIAKPYDQSKIMESERFSTEELCDDLRKQNVDAHSFASVEEIIDFLAQHAQPKDVILIMSNGAFGGIYQKLLARLS